MQNAPDSHSIRENHHYKSNVLLNSCDLQPVSSNIIIQKKKEKRLINLVGVCGAGRRGD